MISKFTADENPTMQAFNRRYEEIDTALTAVSNPNILINGGFQVWQRGTSFTTASDVYTADRWLKAASVSAEKTNDGIKCSMLSIPASLAWLTYKIEEEDYKKIAGQMLTVSAKVRKSRPEIGLRIALAEGAGDINASTEATADWQTISGSGVVLSAYPATFIRVITDNGSILTTSDWIEIAWIKVEVGSNATAFTYKPYVEELTNCQRYAFAFPAQYGGSGSTYNTTTAYVSFLLPTALRRKPTLVNAPASAFRMRCNGQMVTPTAVSVYGAFANSVVLMFTVPALTAYHAAFVYVASLSGVAVLEAEL